MKEHDLPEILRPPGHPVAALSAVLYDFDMSSRERVESLARDLKAGTITMETARLRLRHLYQDLSEPLA